MQMQIKIRMNIELKMNIKTLTKIDIPLSGTLAGLDPN